MNNKRYLFFCPVNLSTNCTVTSLSQLAQLCGNDERTIRKLFRSYEYYFEPRGKWFIQKIDHIQDKSKVRKNSKKNLIQNQATKQYNYTDI